MRRMKKGDHVNAKHKLFTVTVERERSFSMCAKNVTCAVRNLWLNLVVKSDLRKIRMATISVVEILNLNRISSLCAVLAFFLCVLQAHEAQKKLQIMSRCGFLTDPKRAKLSRILRIFVSFRVLGSKQNN
jgi:hypothetical protein